MQAGPLNTRVIIKALGAVDALGQPSQTTTTVATVWAKKQPLRGREVAAAGTIAAEQTETFSIRYRTDIQPRMILEHRSVNYQIEYIAEVGRLESLDLICRRFD